MKKAIKVVALLFLDRPGNKKVHYIELLNYLRSGVAIFGVSCYLLDLLRSQVHVVEIHVPLSIPIV